MLGYIVFLVVAAAVGFWIGSAIFDLYTGRAAVEPPPRRRRARGQGRVRPRPPGRAPVPRDLDPTRPVELPPPAALQPPPSHQPDPPEAWDDGHESTWNELLHIGKGPAEGDTQQLDPSRLPEDIDDDLLPPRRISPPPPPASSPDERRVVDPEPVHFDGAVEDEDWIWPDTATMSPPQHGVTDRRQALELDHTSSGIRMPPPPALLDDPDDGDGFFDEDTPFPTHEAPAIEEDDTINLDLMGEEPLPPAPRRPQPVPDTEDDLGLERLLWGDQRGTPAPLPTETQPAAVPELQTDESYVAPPWSDPLLPDLDDDPHGQDPVTDMPLGQHGDDPNAGDELPIHIGWAQDSEVDPLEGERLDPLFNVDDELQPLLREQDADTSPYVEVVHPPTEAQERSDELELQLLRARFGDLEDERDNLQRAVDELRVRTEAKSRRINQLEEELDTMEARHQDALQIRDSQIIELQGTVAQLSTQANATRLEIKALTRRLRETEAELTQQVRTQAAEPPRDDLRFEVERLGSELDTAKEVIAAREAQIRAREDDLDRLRETIDDLEVALQDSQDDGLFPGPFRGSYQATGTPSTGSRPRRAHLARGDWPEDATGELESK